MTRPRRNRRSGVEDRWTKTVRLPDGATERVPSAANGVGKRWRGRIVDDEGREHAKGFDRKVDAQRWVAEQSAVVVSGIFVDPRAGRVTFEQYFEDWSARQIWVPTTERAMKLAVRMATFRSLPIGAIRRAHIEQWVKTMRTVERKVKGGTEIGLSAGTIRTRFRNVRRVFRGAVVDKVVSEDPTVGVKIPKLRRAEVAMSIPTDAQVAGLIAGADSRHKAMVALAAFAGLRLGEVSALKVEDIDFLRRTLYVRRQVQKSARIQEIRVPKYGSERSVFLADSLVLMLSEHIASNWISPSGWLFPNRGDTGPQDGNTWAPGGKPHGWRPALRPCGSTTYATTTPRA